MDEFSQRSSPKSPKKKTVLNQGTQNDILIVGSNSRVWAALSAHIDNQKLKKNFHAVSSQDIFDLSPSLLRRSFSRAVVFSYSRDLAENMKLLRNLRLFVPSVIYISTCSVIAADRGYPYKYPRVKRAVEIFARDSKLFECLHIIRLGMVEGTFEPGSLKGIYKYTTLAMIAQFIQTPVCQNRTSVRFQNLYRIVENPIGHGLESLCFKCYRRAILFHPVMGAMLRPVDLIFRALGWRWYGYSFIANYD